ncbi:DUF1127 domain-containing protein [Ruegeria sp. TM1040]|jgi:uncharacterized protein YjiS (DUF1127 family)|uniref:DUF1127 domain-containing protein n=1 Tax=Rhodobacterales TaxID=204455 RepID=UPI00004629F4|nr:DUF1127 domain-containing protein [Ruegeria sp. TM1040]ABF65580.1 protein of unknown function DUF1127 [Ruegeria sp. TM1040]MDF9304106.1 DUF1127 domain-containing protein [Tritonibacter mobilis]
MANASNIIAPAGSVAVLRAVDFFFNLRSNFADWNEARITRKALSQLSDAQLEDIGLTRADIAAL